MTRAVTDILYRTDGTAWASAPVTFERTAGSFDDGSSWPPDEKQVTTDATGAYSVQLWPDAAGSIRSRYHVTYPNGDTFYVSIPDGTTPISMPEIRIAAVGVPVPPTTSGEMDAHVHAADPHAQYLLPDELDALYAPLVHTQPWSTITTTPTTLGAYGITDAYTKAEDDAQLATKAPLASPALSGTPTAPTAALGTATTQLATTAFVIANRRVPIVVSAVAGRGDYTTLSAALAAITDASSSKRYTVQVDGIIAETGRLVAKSFIDVIGTGRATIVVTSASGGANTEALVFTNITNAVWANLEIVRAGTLTGAGASNTDCCVIRNTTDPVAGAPHPAFDRVTFRNAIVGSAGVVHCTGLNLVDHTAPTLINCEAYGAPTVQYGYGLLVNDTTNPVVRGGIAQGGSGTNAHGLLTTYNARGVFDSVLCLGTGLAAHGYFGLRASGPTLLDCRFEARGAGGYGIAVISDAVPLISGGKVTGAGVASGDYCVALTNNCAPRIHGLHVLPRDVSVGIPYTAATNGRQQPSPTYPFQLVAINVDPLVANPGITVSLGTTAGGSELATGIDISAADSYPVCTLSTAAQAVLAAGAFIYVTPSAPIADGTIVLHYIYAQAPTNCHGILVDTSGKALIADCTIEVAGGSNGVFVQSNGRANPNWTVANNTIRVRFLETGVGVAVQADASFSNAPFHQNVFWAANGSNMTSYQAGTVHGSNIRRT